MKELFDRRKTELEVAAKNAIVEIYIIGEKIDDMKMVMKSKEKYLVGIDASLREIEYVCEAIENEVKEVKSE